MIGERLKEQRILKKLKQSDLAEYLGVSRSTYTQYETGVSEPDIETIIKLSSFFNVSLDYLFGRTDNQDPGTIVNDWPSDVKIMLRDAAKLTVEQKELIKRLIKEFVNDNK